MDSINDFIYLLVTIFLIIISAYSCFVSRKYMFTIGGHSYSYNNYVHFLFILVASSFFHGGNALVHFRIFVYLCLALLVILIKGRMFIPAKRIIYSFLFFYGWIAFTMTYSEGLYEGFMMLIKYSIPFFFYLLSYISLRTREEYYAWIKRVNFFIVLYVFVNGIAPIAFLRKFLGDWFFGGANTYQMATFVAIPISLYYMTKRKKYLFHVFLYFMPSITHIRRAAFGAIFLASSIMMFWRNKVKAIIIISVSIVLIVGAIFSIKPLQERFFGGDKGIAKATSVTFEDVQEEGLYSHLNTSGREMMWRVVLERFFYESPIVGVGLGTMKSYITSSESEGGRAFLLLHNDYIHLLCETGVVGLSLWCVFMLFIIYEILETLINSKDKFLIFSALITLCSIVAISFIMYFANILSTPMRFMQPFIMFGLFMKLKYMKAKK